MSHLLRSIPALPVRNAPEGAAFYRSRFGFRVGHSDPDFASVHRDEIEIHLWSASDRRWRKRTADGWSVPISSGAESFLAGTGSCRVEVRGIDALYTELKQSRVLYDSTTVVEVQPWGTREFPTLDLERNVLTFFERIRPAHAQPLRKK